MGNQGACGRKGRNPSTTAASHLLWEADERRENRGRLQSSRRFRLASCTCSERRQLRGVSQLESFTSKQTAGDQPFGARCRRTKEREEEQEEGEERERGLEERA